MNKKILTIAFLIYLVLTIFLVVASCPILNLSKHTFKWVLLLFAWDLASVAAIVVFHTHHIQKQIIDHRKYNIKRKIKNKG